METAGSVLVSDCILHLQQTRWEIYRGSKSVLVFSVCVIRMRNDLLFVAGKLMVLCGAKASEVNNLCIFGLHLEQTSSEKTIADRPEGELVKKKWASSGKGLRGLAFPELGRGGSPGHEQQVVREAWL